MDLSRLPEPLRSKLEKQLAALPAEYRAKLEAQLGQLPLDKLEQVLSKTTPIMERLAAKSGSSAGAKSVNTKSGATGSGSGLVAHHTRHHDPNDHFNNTVGRGDRETPPLLVILVVLGMVLMMAATLGWL